jgi:hypothetical protein
MTSVLLSQIAKFKMGTLNCKCMQGKDEHSLFINPATGELLRPE